MSAENRAMRSGGHLNVVLLALLVIAAVSACGGSGGNKAGADVPRTRTLVFEVPDDADPPAAAFAAAVARRTHGRIRIQHDLSSPYTSAVPANELRLVHALEAGTVAVAYLPARAWALAGASDFKALLAPFVLSTERASRRFAQSPLATAVLQSLPTSVVGLALVPVEARRFLATRPLTTKDAFAGLRIRIIDNPQTAADLRSVGARPVERLDAHQAGNLLDAKRLDGVESSPTNILGNGYQTVARYFTTYSPFAKFQSIVVSRHIWEQLSSEQQQELRAAAGAAVAGALLSVPKAERQELTELCQAEGIPARPSVSQLGGIAAAMRATVPRSVSDTAGKELLSQLLRLPGTGVQPLATPLPSRCTRPGSQAAPAAHHGGATIPAGVYTVTDTYKDWLAGGVINPDAKTAITYVTTIRRNGTWYQTQSPNYPDQGPFSGTWEVHGDQLTFVMLRAGTHGQNSVDAPETVRWSYFDGKLILRNLIVADSGARVLYAAHPWRKVR